MLEFWKRGQRMQAMKWGMLDFEDEEPDRPEFKGDRIKSFVDGRDMTYFPPKQHGRLVAARQWRDQRPAAKEELGEPRLARTFFGVVASTRNPLRPRRPYDFQLNDASGARIAFLDISRLMLTEQIEAFIDRPVTLFGTLPPAALRFQPEHVVAARLLSPEPVAQRGDTREALCRDVACPREGHRRRQYVLRCNPESPANWCV
jgi:hypothetical protein